MGVAVLWILAGCNSSLTQDLTNGASGSGGAASGASAASTGGGPETTSTTGAETTSAAGTGSSTGGSSTGASSGTTGTGGATTGAISCGPGSVCVGESCVLVTCVGADGLGCPLPDGGDGACEDGVCWVPGRQPMFANCSTPGASCPGGSHCASPSLQCVTDAGVALESCDQFDCPAGTLCGFPSEIAWPACLTTVCQPGHDYDVCLPDGGQKLVNFSIDVQLCCGSVCADLESDPTNCGGCGVTCAKGEVCRGNCYPTSCEAQPSGSTCALGTCCGASCVDLNSDAANCAVCGLACPTDAGYECDEGACLLHDDGGVNFIYCDDVFDPCPAGWNCIDQLECVPDCSWAPEGTLCGQSRLDVGGSCCGQKCVDLGMDPANCGTCGQPCPQGEACNAGFCQTTDCSKAGGVFTPCLLPSGGEGQCCGGACSDTLSDDANCYSCGQVCPTGSSCHGGVCYLEPLPDAGFPDCTVLGCPANSICADTSDDPYGCVKASCGPFDDNVACVVDGGRTTEGGLGICCGSQCVDKYTDPQNCGMCGLSCGLNTTCLAQTCGTPPGPGPGCGGDAGPCAPGLTCDYVGCLSTTCAGLNNGEPCLNGICCEQQCVDPETDPSNRRGCGMSVAIAPGGNASCGVCTDFSSDLQNCGKCGFACATGQTCVDGGCSSP